jgi:hypothetical protein
MAQLFRLKQINLNSPDRTVLRQVFDHSGAILEEFRIGDILVQNWTDLTRTEHHSFNLRLLAPVGQVFETFTEEQITRLIDLHQSQPGHKTNREATEQFLIKTDGGGVLHGTGHLPLPI